MSTILKALQKVEELSDRQEALPGMTDPLWGLPHANSRRRFCSRLLLLLFLAMSMGGIGFLGLSGNHEEFDIPNKRLSGPPVDAGIMERNPKAPGEKTSVVQAGAVPGRHSDYGEEKEKPEKVASVAAIPETVKKLPTTKIRPRFLVTGIAYQENRAVRFAIINDRAMGEGETIQGAVVEEILEDRVRFARSGATFEVPLAKGSGR